MTGTNGHPTACKIIAAYPPIDNLPQINAEDAKWCIDTDATEVIVNVVSVIKIGEPAPLQSEYEVQDVYI